ncbi:MAG: hypothetical protein H7258_02555 [Ferruginibacter sp.]|nr:hypothetical protein [Ferruginibacter sp.]
MAIFFRSNTSRIPGDNILETTVRFLQIRMNANAVIFDFDDILTHNNAFHLIAWK